ncbi:ATP-binding protein [Arthrobacter oryzae]|uniref:ATP-binding protein n=1 Tax=Arthrobacter oryzae TaxID=409290 RepID=UPI0027D8F532|nr:ATP-binding protein [Arthrobacter oryzae]
MLIARARGRYNGQSTGVTAEDVTEAAVGIVDRDLARLASRLDTSRDWSHLVVPPALRADLSDLVEQANGRAFVLTKMGFGEQPGQPRGVTAVFAGPSGTGKTMAARLVAGELGLPLYRVDLARTVSKYIGETERNLDAVFAAAEQSDAVLLFDEAEALFGKRSEVQDAHDRYANLEIAFLLQRMESYQGVAILATNLLGHLDDAFARRLSFCIHFPFPDAAQRSLIWRSIWPPPVTLEDGIDFDGLAAQHPLSGGHIRNIAVAAVHLARVKGTVVDRACLDRAISREYSKLGLVLNLFEGAAP